MLYLASSLTSHRAIFFAGALNRDLLPLTITADAPSPSSDSISPLYNIAELAQYNIPSVITTDDGSYAFHGLVTQALEQYLTRFFPEPRTPTPETRNPNPETPNPKSEPPNPKPQTRNPTPETRPTLYTCGPEPMMKRVAAIALAHNLPCQISVERAMACGMGTCQSCVIRVKKPDPAKPPLAGKDSCYRLACTDGPIFPAADLLW